MQSNDTIMKTYLSNEFHKILKKQGNVDNCFFNFIENTIFVNKNIINIYYFFLLLYYYS